MEQHLITLLLRIGVAASIASVGVRILGGAGACCCAKNARSPSASGWRSGSPPSSRPGSCSGWSTRVLFGARSGARRQPAGRHHRRLCLRMAGGHDDRDSLDVRRELLSLPFLAVVGLVGGLLRDSASDKEDIWRFSPIPSVNVYRHLPAPPRTPQRAVPSLFRLCRGRYRISAPGAGHVSSTENCSPSRAGAIRRFCSPPFTPPLISASRSRSRSGTTRATKSSSKSRNGC